MLFRIFCGVLTFFVTMPITGFATSYNWRIMPLGNSITVGVHGSDPVGGYRDDLQVLLGDNGYGYNFIGTRKDGDPAVFDVDHQGTGGIRADEILLDIDYWLSQNPPDIVLLHIGTNDISQGNDVNSTVDEIGQIMDHIYNFDLKIEILLASIVPRSDSKNVFTDELNQGIRNLITTKQNENYLVHYIPINEAFKENNNWSTEYLDDSVHPNNEGYHVMALEWYDVVVNVIEGDPNPPPPPVQPASMHIVSGNEQSSEIYSLLPEPLVVQVLDENENPVADVNLNFESQSGNGAIQTDASGRTLFIEAESGQINSPCKIVEDNNASNNSYVVSEVRKSGDFTLTVNITQEADYYFWGRVFAPSTDEDSFFLLIDDIPDTILWDLWAHEHWYWEEVADRSLGRMSFHFTTGKHLIKFVTREDHSRLDKILITDNPNLVPQGVSGFPDIYTDQNGEAIVYWLLGNEIGTQTIEVTSPSLVDHILTFGANAFSDENQDIQIAGNVGYYTGDHTVSNIQVHLNDTDADSTDNLGDFSFQHLEIGNNYIIWSDSNVAAENAANTIISYDAALTSRYAVGLEDLTPYQVVAADADNDGQILTYDASLIARFAVGLEPIGNSQVGNWIFDPESYEYTNLDSSVTGANFVGIVRGDVHGGWQPPGLAKSYIVETSLLEDAYFTINDTLIFTIPLKSDETIYSFDLDISFPPSDYEMIALDISQIQESFRIFENKKLGNIRIGGFSHQGINYESQIIVKYLVKTRKITGAISLNLFRINNNVPIKSEFNFYTDIEFPTKFTLYQNYPNPFNQETVLSFFLPNAGQVTIRIFNSIGQEIWALVRTYETSGTKKVKFFGKDRFGRELQSGNYYLRIQVGNGNVLNQKISIVK